MKHKAIFYLLNILLSFSFIGTMNAEVHVSDSIPYPWTQIDLTAVEAKVLEVAPVVEDGTFPWIPVIGGVVTVGTLTYFLTKDDKGNPIDCSFTANAVTVAPECGLSNGAINIDLNPTTQYEYIWSNGATSSSLQNIPAGSYSTTITRIGSTCSQILSSILVNGDRTFETSSITEDAHCGQEDGSASVSVSPPGLYTFLWSNGAAIASINNVPSGMYSVTVSAGGTCTAEYSITIGELPPSFTTTITTTPANCDMNDGSALVTLEPEDTYEYLWSDGQTGAQANNLSSGVYTVTVSIVGTTCIKIESVTIDELPASFKVSVTSTTAGCGLSDGTAAATVDPQGVYDFLWSNGLTGAQVSGLAAGDYTVTVTVSGTDCSKQASVTIGSDPFPYDVALTTTPAHCSVADGSASVVVTPQGEFGYQWSNGGNGAQLTGLNAGSYTVTVTDVVTSCAETFTVTVDELPADIILSFTTTPAGCGVSNGSATVMADPPVAYTYLWSNGNTTPQLSGVASGTYSVTVTIMGTNCSNAASVEIEQAGGGFTATFSIDNADCGVTNGSVNITIDPPAEYTYQWSNQQTGPALNQIPSGTYSVTVTDANSCKEEFSVTVSENPAEFIFIVSTSPGDCTGGGDITFTLSTPGTGPLNVQVEGPQGTMPLSLSTGTYQLSAFISVLPGTYTITVYDEQIGIRCIENVNATVQDNTPALVVTNDFYTTPGGQPVFENALGNDSGLNIVMTSVSDEFGGTVTFTASGDFTFIPDQGFSGEAHFIYTIMDACGITATGIVTIDVEIVVCDFIVDFETIPASCGLDDGEITADVFGPGSYAYEWSNGDTGPTISTIPSDSYTVTITDINLGCDLVFEVDLTENPAEYIDDIFIIQPACGAGGEIRFTANTNSGNQLILTITHPNGSDQFFVESGDIFLSDYILITPGDYLIEVTDEGANGDCVESFEATLVASAALVIFTETIIPPSSPPAMDGIIVIVTAVTGVLPYTVLLNGLPYTTANQHNFQILGLGVGAYTVQIVDAQGCESNILDVFVPLPDIILSFGTNIIHGPSNARNESPLLPEPEAHWRSSLVTSIQYPIGHTMQELRILYAMPYTTFNHLPTMGFVEFEYLSSIKSLQWNSLRIHLQGGLGMHIIDQPNQASSTSSTDQYFTLRASTGYSVSRLFTLQGRVSLRAWARLQKPIVEFTASVPFPAMSFRRSSLLHHSNHDVRNGKK